MNKLLTTYWFEFEGWGIGSYAGVTAYSLDDAKYLLKKHFFKDFLKQELPQIKNIIENVQVKDLDQIHIVPNLGPISERGVWCPNLYGYQIGK